MKRAHHAPKNINEDIVVTVALYSPVNTVAKLWVLNKACHKRMFTPQFWRDLVFRDFPLLKYYTSTENRYRQNFDNKPLTFWRKFYYLKYFQKDPYSKLLYLTKKDRITQTMDNIKKQVTYMQNSHLVHALMEYGIDPYYDCVNDAYIMTHAYYNETEKGDREREFGGKKYETSFKAYFLSPNATLLKSTLTFSWFRDYCDSGACRPEITALVENVETGRIFDLQEMDSKECAAFADYAGMRDLGGETITTAFVHDMHWGIKDMDSFYWEFEDVTVNDT
jgi:hypothetical protein